MDFKRIISDAFLGQVYVARSPNCAVVAVISWLCTYLPSDNSALSYRRPPLVFMGPAWRILSIFCIVPTTSLEVARLRIDASDSEILSLFVISKYPPHMPTYVSASLPLYVHSGIGVLSRVPVVWITEALGIIVKAIASYYHYL